MTQINLFTNEKQTHRLTEDLRVFKEEGWGITKRKDGR